MAVVQRIAEWRQTSGRETLDTGPDGDRRDLPLFAERDRGQNRPLSDAVVSDSWLTVRRQASVQIMGLLSHTVDFGLRYWAFRLVMLGIGITLEVRLWRTLHHCPGDDVRRNEPRDKTIPGVESE